MKKIAAYIFLPILFLFLTAGYNFAGKPDSNRKVADQALSPPFPQVGEYVIRDAAQLAEMRQYLKLKEPFPNGKLREIVIKRSIPVRVEQRNEEIKPTGTHALRNVKFEGTICGVQVLHRTSAPGPGRLSLTVTNSVSNSYTATVSLSPATLSASVGFHVTATEPITDSSSLGVPSGGIRYFEAHPLLDHYSFEIWDTPWYGWDRKVGDGIASRVSGICYASWTY